MHRNPYKLSWLLRGVAFAMGLAGELYIQMPAIGTLPMLDIFSYSVSGLIILFCWTRMGRYVRQSFLIAFLWAFASLFASLVNGWDERTILKSVVVVSSSWAIMSVAWLVLKSDARLYLYYLVGVGLGSYVALYYFKQGAWLSMEVKGGDDLQYLLLDKQKFPIYANAIFFCGVLPLLLLLKKFPFVFVVVGCLFSAFFLLVNGGSRSNFGFYMAAAGLGISVMYGGSMVKRIFKSRISLFVTVLFSIGMVFTLYKVMVSTGAMGEGEKDKYETEFGNAKTGHGGLIGRGSYDQSFDALLKAPWGNGGVCRYHSVLSSAMFAEGIMGIVFWVYFFAQLLWFISRRMIYAGRFTPFIALMICSSGWAVLGSPFGARHSFFVLMAYIALCRSDLNYGNGVVFSFPQRFFQPRRCYVG